MTMIPENDTYNDEVQDFSDSKEFGKLTLWYMVKSLFIGAVITALILILFFELQYQLSGK